MSSTLIKNKDLVIQKADKCNTVVILNKKDYKLKMKKILSDTSKFHKLSIDQNKVLNHIVNMENRIISVLKKLKGCVHYICASLFFTSKQKHLSN